MHLYSHSLLWSSQLPWEVSRRDNNISILTHKATSSSFSRLWGPLGNVFICNCQVNFAQRAAWGETKSKTHVGLVHLCRSVITWHPFPLFLWYNVYYHLQMSSGYLFPYHSFKSTLHREYNICPQSRNLCSPVLSCFSHQAYCFLTYYIVHTMYLLSGFHWNVRSLRVRIYVCFVPISLATEIGLAKGSIKCQHESLGADKNWGQERSVVAPLREYFPFQGWEW